MKIFQKRTQDASVPFASDRSVQDDSIKWNEAAQSLSPEILQDSPRLKHQESDSNLHPSWHRQLPASTLNKNQKTAYDEICHHHQQHIIGNKPTPLRMIIMWNCWYR